MRSIPTCQRRNPGTDCYVPASPSATTSTFTIRKVSGNFYSCGERLHATFCVLGGQVFAARTTAVCTPVPPTPSLQLSLFSLFTPLFILRQIRRTFFFGYRPKNFFVLPSLRARESIPLGPPFLDWLLFSLSEANQGYPLNRHSNIASSTRSHLKLSPPPHDVPPHFLALSPLLVWKFFIHLLD